MIPTMRSKPERVDRREHMQTWMALTIKERTGEYVQSIFPERYAPRGSEGRQLAAEQMRDLRRAFREINSHPNAQ